MIFPELREAAGQLWKRFAPDKGEPITLGLKQAGGVSFDSISAGWYLRQGYPQIYALLTGGMPAWSGESVSIETALNHSVVFACNKIITECVGFTPSVIMQRTPAGKREASELPMFNAMQYEPNEEVSATSFTQMLTSHCLLSGNGFAQIVRRSGTGVAVQLRIILPEQVKIDRNKQGQVVYLIHEQGMSDKVYTLVPGKPHDILHLRGAGWDGLRGMSIITLGRQSIGTAIAGERNVARFWANGGRVPYHLEMENKFKDDSQFEKFRDDWEKIYAEPWRAPILEHGITYKQDGLNMRDAQAIEWRQAEVSEICRWFNVSPPLVHDLSRATFSNIEQLFLYFKNLTLAQWYGVWESDFHRCVFTEEEKAKGYYLHHDARSLLRGDLKMRFESYSTALQNGFLSIDEVRDNEQLDPLPNGSGEHHHIQLNLQALPEDGSAIPPPQPKQGAAEASAPPTKHDVVPLRRVQ